MDSQLLTLPLADWRGAQSDRAVITALEAGKVLHFPQLAFELQPHELRLLDAALIAPGVRNISLNPSSDAAESHVGHLKGVAGDADVQRDTAAMVARFRAQAVRLIEGLLPHYSTALRLAPTSFRPAQVQTRVQSWRADDKRLHVDAFPSRPNRGERILRVFVNVNPHGAARLWRVGEPFEAVARRFLPRLAPYSRWRARLLRAARVTKSLRSEYDHLMLQLHDTMKSDMDYQRDAPQEHVAFGAGSAWVCFSDQTSHAVLAGQHMLEQTLHLAPSHQYDANASPLAILTRLVGRTLV
ncbi:MAG: Kdo hydroxylase family protein [Variovorax sp.]